MLGTKFVSIRTVASSRLKMYLNTYAFLRDLYYKEFWSPKIQTGVNTLAQAPALAPGTKKDTSKCGYCHGGPKVHRPCALANCPFHKAGISKSEAKPLAARVEGGDGRLKPVIEEHQAGGGGGYEGSG